MDVVELLMLLNDFNMRTKIFTLFLIAFILIDCKSGKVEDDNLDKDVFNFVINKIIPQFIDKPFDICGSFNAELPDSLVAGSLRSIFDDNNIEHIVNRYNLTKNRPIDSYIDQTKFNKRTGSVYYDNDSILYHFILSAPLFNISSDTCVIFSLVMPISFQGPSTRDGFYFLIGVNNDTLKYLGVQKNAYTTFIPKTKWEHHHNYSFIPSRISGSAPTRDKQ